jgi:hypothetical protein
MVSFLPISGQEILARLKQALHGMLVDLHEESVMFDIGLIVYTNFQVVRVTHREAFWVSDLARMIILAFDNGSKAELVLAGFG